VIDGRGLDDATVAKLRRSAERAAKPQSEIVREAISDYAERIGRLSEAERRRLLRVFDTLVPAIPARPAREVAAEIRAVRAARRAGGRGRRAT
jgi:Ribbon-helix-helix protein, copG family